MALPMREDVDSLRIFQRLLEKERGLASRWRKQVDHSAWMDPQLSHHESRLKPGDGVRMSLSRSHPGLTGASGTVLCIDAPSEGGLVTVKLTPAHSKPKKLKVQPWLLLQGRNTSGDFPMDLTERPKDGRHAPQFLNKKLPKSAFSATR
ncbi:unnamed protein product [Cladocopium goreaui]|uniref:Uncharacterized protein n=1 Tax=Cladocopium goreaui TaxID=2562237 RepID=A0A9P1D9V9_9DINO|nr:unnamed protein product [Cladocopium goreaui]